jgi:hypothetical protein
MRNGDPQPLPSVRSSSPAPNDEPTLVRRVFSVVPIILLYSILAPLLINTGIADNGDFTRSMQWFIEKPAAFATNWPSDDAAWKRRFANFWIDAWTMKPSAEIGVMESYSSAQLLNMAGIAANTVAGNADYSLRTASIPARIVELAGFAALAVLFHAATRSAALTFVTLLFVSAILLDLSYKAFFNSFYEERASLLYLTILVPATITSFKAGSGWGWKVLFAAALALFASSKAQFAPTPAILLTVHLLHLGASTLFTRPAGPAPSSALGGRRLVSTVVLFLIPQIIALVVTSGYGFGKVNAYNSVFLGALTFSEEPLRHLDDFPPDAARCIGANVYHPDTCFKEMSPHTTHGNAIKIYLADLPALTRAATFAAEAMHGIALDELSKRHLDDAVTPVIAPTFWTSTKGLMPKGIGFYGMVLAVSALLLPLSRIAELKPFALVAQFLNAIALSQTVIVVVGDGRAEIQKHLLVANFAFDLAFVLTIAFAVYAMISVGRRAPPPLFTIHSRS